MSEPAHDSCCAPGASLQRVVDALERVGSNPKRRARFTCRCPAHPDHRESLSVTHTGDEDGKVLLNCFTGCDYRDVAAALGLSPAELFDQPLTRQASSGRPRAGRSTDQRRQGRRRGRRGPLPASLVTPDETDVAETEHRYRTSETYTYVDTHGEVVQQVDRRVCVACPEQHKSFAQRYIWQGQWVSKKEDLPEPFMPVWYRQVELVAAVTTGTRIWVLEGEKDVHTAEAAGLVATTNTGGATSVPDELLDMLAGAQVNVVLDRDAAGWRRGETLYRGLTARGASVALFVPAVEYEHADLTDHIDAGHDVSDLVAVTVMEVTAWSHASSARDTKLGPVLACLDETEAQLAAAAEADQRGATRRAADHRRYAQRWVAESELRFEPLLEAAGAAGEQTEAAGTTWAGQAGQAAAEAAERGRSAVVSTHEMCGVSVPAALLPSQTAGHRVAADSNGEEHENTGRQRFEDLPPGVRLMRPRYRIIGGSICMLEPSRGRNDDDDDENSGNWKPLLNLDLRITAWEFLESDAEAEGAQLTSELGMPEPTETGQITNERTLTHVRFSYTDPRSGEVMTQRVEADRARTSEWLTSLGLPLEWNPGRRGQDQLWGALLAMSGDAESVVLHRATGWRPDGDERSKFVHAAGAITAEGHTPATTLLTGELSRYSLPVPTSDPQQLREAFLEHSAGMMTRIPSRITAPLLGAVYRSAIGHNPWVCALIGLKATYKTGVAALAMHHWGQRWDRHEPGASMRGAGHTANYVRTLTHGAKDTLFWADDFAPTNGIQVAQTRLEEFTSSIHEKMARGRLTRTAEMQPGTPPRSSGLVTSEISPPANSSGADRLLPVPMLKGAVDRDDVLAFDIPQSRYARSLVMASMLQWMADKRELVHHEARNWQEDLASELREAGHTAREADGFGSYWAGWITVTWFLREVGAIDEDEITHLRNQVRAALIEAARMATDPDLPVNMGARMVELIRHVLHTRQAHLLDVRTGDAPEWPLAARLGWQRTQVGIDAAAEPTYRLDRGGVPLGYVKTETRPQDGGAAELLLNDVALDELLTAAAGRASEGMKLDRAAILRCLADDRLIETDGAHRKVRRSLLCLAAEGERPPSPRMVVMRLDTLFGGDEAAGGQQPAVPAPTAPHGPGERIVDLLGQSPAGGEETEADWLSSAETDGFVEQAHEEQEHVMGSYTDAAGFTAQAESIDGRQACVICGGLAGFRFAAQPAHVPCFEASTGTQRSAAALPADQHDPQMTGSRADGAKRADSTSPRRAQAAATLFVASVAVLHTDGVWLPDGQRVDPPTITHLGELAELARRLRLGTVLASWTAKTGESRQRCEGGQLVLTNEAAAALGIDLDQITMASDRATALGELTRDCELVTKAVQAGWTLGHPGDRLRPWTRIWREDDGQVGARIVLAGMLDETDLPLLAGKPGPALLAKRLQAFVDAYGYPFSGGAQSTGLDSMISSRRRFDWQTEFAPENPVGAVRRTREEEFSWSRVPSEAERGCVNVVAYDRGASHPAAIAGLRLPIGDPIHHPDGDVRIDASRPALLRVVPGEPGDVRFPHPMNPRRSWDEPMWVTAPTWQIAAELGHEPEILEAYTWDEHGLFLVPWYERLRGALAGLDPDNDAEQQLVRETIKAIYTRTIGMMGSDSHMAGRFGYAPTRRLHIAAKARANTLRKVVAIGRETGLWPLAMSIDTVVYATDSDDPRAAWPGQAKDLGRGMGKFKPEGIARMGEHAQYLTGQRYAGKDELLAPDAFLAGQAVAG